MFAQAKARGTLLGLAVGDALGQPTEGKTMEFIQERWGRITGFLSDDPVRATIQNARCSAHASGTRLCPHK